MKQGLLSGVGQVTRELWVLGSAVSWVVETRRARVWGWSDSQQAQDSRRNGISVQVQRQRKTPFTSSEAGRQAEVL